LVCRRFGGQFLWTGTGLDDTQAKAIAHEAAAQVFVADGGDERAVDVVLGVAHVAQGESYNIPFETLLRSALSSLRTAEKRDSGGVVMRQLGLPRAA
jgi:hypothetical protein